MRVNCENPSRLILAALMLAILAALTATGYAQRGAQPPAAASGQQPSPGTDVPCPGQTMPSVQATGVYQMKTVPEIVINGQPAPGAMWQPGMRSYWHCHAGGQVMLVMDGVGRVQKRGERVRVLHKGDTEYAGPGVEHWHGAAADAAAQFFQVSISPTAVYWMEEVGRDDYMGNDNGINSRNEFIRSGVRQKPNMKER